MGQGAVDGRYELENKRLATSREHLTEGIRGRYKVMLPFIASVLLEKATHLACGSCLLRFGKSVSDGAES
jgi:hypothetical protein